MTEVAEDSVLEMTLLAQLLMWSVDLTLHCRATASVVTAKSICRTGVMTVLTQGRLLNPSQGSRSLFEQARPT